ncbi:MAG: hypothetical protein ACFWUM_05030 [Eubacteriales bacterium]
MSLLNLVLTGQIIRAKTNVVEPGIDRTDYTGYVVIEYTKTI